MASQAADILKGKFIEVGFFKKLKGFEGELQIRLNREVKENYAFGFIIVLIDGTEVPFKVSRFYLQNQEIAVVRLEEIREIEEAKSLLGCMVKLEISAIVKTGEMVDDRNEIKDFTVVDSNQNLLGTVQGFEDTIKTESIILSTPQGKKVQIPFHQAFIKCIDEQERRIEVSLPDGFIEVFFNEE